jgi:hypothetical protein
MTKRQPDDVTDRWTWIAGMAFAGFMTAAIVGASYIMLSQGGPPSAEFYSPQDNRVG